MEALDDAVDKYRGYGVRLQFYVQSLGQLKKMFPDGQDQTLLSNVSQVFFGVNDWSTAEYVSNRLGEATIIIDSGGDGTGISRQYSSTGGTSITVSQNHSDNWAQHGRKLLRPEEVLGLPHRTAITFTPGVAPICTRLIRYYEEPNLETKPSAWEMYKSVSSVFTWSLLLLFASGILAIAFCGNHQSQLPAQQPSARYQQQNPHLKGKVRHVSKT
jgi:type IV secretion system protein VirD4